MLFLDGCGLYCTVLRQPGSGHFGKHIALELRYGGAWMRCMLCRGERFASYLELSRGLGLHG